jgi:hypothetical protein
VSEGVKDGTREDATRCVWWLTLLFFLSPTAQNFGVALNCLVSSGDDSASIRTANAETTVSLAFAPLLSVKDLED